MCEETVLSKVAWKAAIGATKEPKRLMLLSHNGLFIRPAVYCESKSYRSRCGFRKHVLTKHGCYCCFKEKPAIAKAFPEFSTRANNYQLPT